MKCYGIYLMSTLMIRPKTPETNNAFGNQMHTVAKRDAPGQS